MASGLEIDVSPLMRELIRTVATDDRKRLSKSERAAEGRKSPGMALTFIDPDEIPRDSSERKKAAETSLSKALTRALDGNSDIDRLAFTVDPAQKTAYSALYYSKQRLCPDELLKRISIQEDLVASIVQVRSAHISSFGRKRTDRHSIGFKMNPLHGVLESMNDEQKKALKDRIERAEKLLSTCGRTNGYKRTEQMNFSQYLLMSARNAVINGRIATEIVKTRQREPHSFRPVDAGTIYKAVPQQDQAANLRRQAMQQLQELQGKGMLKRLDPNRFMKDDYEWIQVVAGTPRQAFTDTELVVHNFYPVTDIELGGYPLTPLDTVLSAVMTRINITTHNKLYFQSGRASRGMLVIKSEDADPAVVARIRQQFNASINSVTNAWRMPVFGISTTDDITWSSIDSGGRDMEFQFLADANARTILAAFSLSPDELAAYAYLSRGTNSQALSESNQEYRLTAARDVGIKPLLKQFEDFINTYLMPVVDPGLSELVTVQLLGLDAETAEKEATRIGQDQGLHMTYDEILDKVEKDVVGPEWGGDVPLNPGFLNVLDTQTGLMVGERYAHFLKRPELKNRPDLQYVRDPFWFQWQTLLLQQKQLEAQQQQQTQETQQQQQGQQEDDLSPAIDQAMQSLSKSERPMPSSRKRLLQQHQAVVDDFLSHWEQEVKKTQAAIVDAVSPAVKRVAKKVN